MKKFMKCSFSGLLLGIVLFFPGSCKKDPPPPPFPTIEVNDLIWSAVNVTGEVTCGINYPNPANTQLYGQLYTFDCAQQIVAALGNDWRIPTVEDWEKLAEYAGGMNYWQVGTQFGDSKAAYSNLMAGGSTGFNALPGGSFSNGSYYYVGTHGCYWTSTYVGGNKTAYILFHGGESDLLRSWADPEGTLASAMSLRVVRDL